MEAYTHEEEQRRVKGEDDDVHEGAEEGFPAKSVSSKLNRMRQRGEHRSYLPPGRQFFDRRVDAADEEQWDADEVEGHHHLPWALARHGGEHYTHCRET